MASYHGERRVTLSLRSSLMPQTQAGVALPGAPKETRDHWSPDDLEVSGGIAVKGAKALYQTLSIFCNGRVDAYVDNSNLIDFWNGGGRNIILTNEIHDLFLLSMELNIALNMHYVLSKLNMADPPPPSTFYSDLDCALSTPTWNLVDKAFGPHSFDLRALPSNVKKSRNGCDLRFYSPSHFNNKSSGVNVFAQSLSPPITLPCPGHPRKQETIGPQMT